MDTLGFQEIGSIVKVHGLKGELVASLDFDIAFQQGDLIYVEGKKKQLLPYRIELAYSRELQNRLSFFLKFENVDDRSSAELLNGAALYLPADELAEADEDELPDIIGWLVYNQSEQFGEVADVLETPAHLVIEIHHDTEGSVMIPWVDEYITKVDEQQHRIEAQHLDRFL